MPFTPTAEKLLPDLTPREELVLLARTLWREGYNDHLAGHITINVGDGTLLCNPWLLTWDEIRPRDDLLEILLGDRALEMPGWLEPALRLIAASDRFRPRDLAPEIGDPASRLVLIRRLVREGLLVPDDLGIR